MILYCSECNDYEIREQERKCPMCSEWEYEMSEEDLLEHLRILQEVIENNVVSK